MMMLGTPIERDVTVVFETANVAVSFGPFGIVPGVQLAAVFQSLLVGLMFHVALPAWPEWMVRSNNMAGRRSAAVNVVRGRARG